MAENEYHIYIHAKSDSEENKSPVAGETGSGDKYWEKTEKSLEKGLKGLVSFGAIKNTAQKLVNTQVSTIELRTGASEYEQQQQTITNAVFKGIGTLGAVAVGASTGNLPLVLIGIATDLISTLFDYMQKAREIQLKTSLENVSIRLNQIRAGVSGRRSSSQ